MRNYLRTNLDGSGSNSYVAFSSARRAMPASALEFNRKQVAARLEREGWTCRHGGGHDIYKHAAKRGRIVLPRHKVLSPGVARAVAKQAGWLE